MQIMREQWFFSQTTGENDALNDELCQRLLLIFSSVVVFKRQEETSGVHLL